jgi:tetratricopeptide (TPR) repeat protein
MADDILAPEPEEKPEDTMFRDAVDALRRGDKPRAKELLTLLLKTDQNNATYWIWLSAAVENAKERVYCLQTAHKLDPENNTAKRGLVLHGAIAPDETVQPFSLNRPRAWEEKLLLANEKPKEKGFKAFTKNPATRLAGIVLIGAALVSVAVFTFVKPTQVLYPTQTVTPGPSPTFTATPTVFGATAGPTKPFVGPTPLWMLLPATYTPTPLYVNTPRAPQSVDQYRSAKAAYQAGDWDGYIASLKLIIPLEPKAADIYYLMGDAYRFKNDPKDAIESYNQALKINPNFGAPYLGLARARLMDDPNLNVEYLYDEAIKRDPEFGEIYIDRARYYIANKNPKSAILDLDTASKLLPGSPLVYSIYAEAYLALGDTEKALKAAEKSYSLDSTDPAIYKTLGTLYIEGGQYQRAIEALNVYVIYATEDYKAFALLGRAYYEMGDYQSSIKSFDKAEEINPNGLKKFYAYKGLANMALNYTDQAVDDLEKALDDNGESFEINLALAQGYYKQEKYGSTYLRAEALKSLAKTDKEAAIALYWHALSQEKRNALQEAIKDWQTLLAMDKNAMTPEMRTEAEQHLSAIVTSTNTPIPSNTPRPGTATPTPKPGKATPTGTATPTPKGGSPTATPTSLSGTITPTTKAGATPSVTPTPK